MIDGAIVLAGGRSSRYGRDKASLPLGDGTLLEHVVTVAGQVAGRVVVVGGARLPAGGSSLVGDLEPGGGPLQAAVAGSRALCQGRCLLLACDLPFICTALLELLAVYEGGVARIARVAGRAQYLAACYGPAAWRTFEERRNHGCRSLHGACRDLPIRWLDEHDLAAAGVPLAALLDVDTPDDWPRG